MVCVPRVGFAPGLAMLCATSDLTPSPHAASDLATVMSCTLGGVWSLPMRHELRQTNQSTLDPLLQSLCLRDHGE